MNEDKNLKTKLAFSEKRRTQRRDVCESKIERCVGKKGPTMQKRKVGKAKVFIPIQNSKGKAKILFTDKILETVKTEKSKTTKTKPKIDFIKRNKMSVKSSTDLRKNSKLKENKEMKIRETNS